MKTEDENLIPEFMLGLTAFVCAAAIVAIAVLGPAMLNVIHYRTSLSGILQTEAFDLTNLIVLAPALVIGGTLIAMKKTNSKYFLILTPIMLIYSGLEYGIGQEWGNPAYTGNSEAFCGLFLTLTIGGLILLLGSLPQFTSKDAPDFSLMGLRIYVGIMAFFLLMFGFMWTSQLAQVISTGNTTAGDYLVTPTAWWMVKFMDLGVTIPLGFLALLLLLFKPKKAYPLVLLSFGFFVTIGTAVNASAVIEVVNKDPSITLGSGTAGIIVFPVLGALAYGGLFYLIKDKLPSKTHKQLEYSPMNNQSPVRNQENGGTIVVYRSKYGATKRYAYWIAEELKTKVYDATKLDADSLQRYSTVLYGSSVHIGRIKGIDFVKKNWDVLSKKKVIIFASTGTSNVLPQQHQAIEASLPGNINQSVTYFPLPGAYNYSKLDFTDKFLMNFGPLRKLRFNAWFRGDKRAKEQRAQLHAVMDWTTKEAINPIIEFINNKHFQ